MEIKNEVFQHLEVVARSRNGHILGVALFTLSVGFFPNTYDIDEFLIEMFDQSVTTSENYPQEVRQYFEDVIIQFPDNDKISQEMIQISKVFFPDFGTITYRFFNREILEAFGGSVDI